MGDAVAGAAGLLVFGAVLVLAVFGEFMIRRRCRTCFAGILGRGGDGRGSSGSGQNIIICYRSSEWRSGWQREVGELDVGEAVAGAAGLLVFGAALVLAVFGGFAIRRRWRTRYFGGILGSDSDGGGSSADGQKTIICDGWLDQWEHFDFDLRSSWHCSICRFVHSSGQVAVALANQFVPRVSITKDWASLKDGVFCRHSWKRR